MTDASEIEARIRSAFHGVTLDGGVSLRQAEVMDRYGEGVTAAEFNALPQGEITEDWTRLTPEVLDACGVIAHLDARGFCYYIPAFMLRLMALYEPSSMRVIGTLISLYPKKDELWDHHMAKYSLLSGEQSTAIAHFLQSLPHLVELDADDEKIVQRAIRNYWHQFL